MDQPPNTPVQPTPPMEAKPAPWKATPWPKLWEHSLAFVLGICAVILVQSAWKLWRPPTPLALAPGSVDLNLAQASELRQLPGVGPQLADRIVDHRQKHGPFQKVDDLQAVHGIGPATLERLRHFVLVSQAGGEAPPVAPVPLRSGPKSLPPQPLDLNQATAQELANLPGIGPALAERIVQDRQEHGKFESVNDLTRIRGIKSKTVEKLAPYVTIGKPERRT